METFELLQKYCREPCNKVSLTRDQVQNVMGSQFLTDTNSFDIINRIFSKKYGSLRTIMSNIDKIQSEIQEK